MKRSVAALVFLSSLSPVLQAEDINEILDNLNGYVLEKNYPKALEELEWARKELERLKNERLKAFFPDTVDGYQGGELQVEQALGYSALSRRYLRTTDTGEEAITATLGAGLAGLEQMMEQMALLFQGVVSSGVETFRIAGRTAVLSRDPEGGETTLTVKLKSGSQLVFETKAGDGAEKLKAFAKVFDIDGLDDYLSQ